MYFVLVDLMMQLNVIVTSQELGESGRKERGMIDFSGRIHWQFAFIIWLLMVGVNNVWFNPIPFLIGSVFPDCDHKNAPMGRLFPVWLVCNHRGFTHTIWGMVLFSLPLGMFYSWKWCMIFACGYFLHLIMDSGTPMGIKWIRGHKRRKAYSVKG